MSDTRKQKAQAGHGALHRIRTGQDSTASLHDDGACISTNHEFPYPLLVSTWDNLESVGLRQTRDVNRISEWLLKRGRRRASKFS